MRTVYKTTVIKHIWSLRGTLIGIFVLFFGYCYGESIEKDNIDIEAFITVGSLMLIPVLAPVVFLHISYYLKNFGFKLIIDESQNIFVMSEDGQEHFYNFSDLILVEQHLSIYYKNKVDHSNRNMLPWTPYGYLLIKFKDGSRFYVTSLMIDVLNPPIDITDKCFRFFPYMKSIEFSKSRVFIDDYENRISHYKLTFKDHSNQELNEKIINRKTYDKAAVEAARRILSARSTVIKKNSLSEY